MQGLPHFHAGYPLAKLMTGTAYSGCCPAADKESSAKRLPQSSDQAPPLGCLQQILQRNVMWCRSSLTICHVFELTRAAAPASALIPAPLVSAAAEDKLCSA
jgi:hypothetical protein